MKVFIAIIAACVLLSGTHATGTATKPGEQIIGWIYDTMMGDASGDQPHEKVINPSLIADEVACYAQYREMDMNFLRIGSDNILKCYKVIPEKMNAIFNSKVGSMYMANFKMNLKQCATMKGIEAKLECVADMTEKFLHAADVFAMPVMLETKYCVRYELHRILTGFYQSHMELEKCLVRVKINASMPMQPQVPSVPDMPVPDTPQAPSAPMSPMQNIQSQIQAKKGQQQQQQ